MVLFSNSKPCLPDEENADLGQGKVFSETTFSTALDARSSLTTTSSFPFMLSDFQHDECANEGLFCIPGKSCFICPLSHIIFPPKEH